MKLIYELARLGELIHAGQKEPAGLEAFLRLSDDQIRELNKELTDFYRLGTLEDWKVYYFARFCLHYIVARQKGDKK